MSLWELLACIDGVARANSPDQVRPPTEEEHDALIAKYGDV